MFSLWHKGILETLPCSLYWSYHFLVIEVSKPNSNVRVEERIMCQSAALSTFFWGGEWEALNWHWHVSLADKRVNPQNNNIAPDWKIGGWRLVIVCSKVPCWYLNRSIRNQHTTLVHLQYSEATDYPPMSSSKVCLFLTCWQGLPSLWSIRPAIAGYNQTGVGWLSFLGSCVSQDADKSLAKAGWFGFGQKFNTEKAGHGNISVCFFHKSVQSC